LTGSHTSSVLFSS